MRKLVKQMNCLPLTAYRLRIEESANRQMATGCEIWDVRYCDVRVNLSAVGRLSDKEA